MDKDVESHRIIQGHDTYSQAHQDLFVRYMLDFKRSGIYVEVGASEPKQSNNTYILEHQLDWKGISLEIDPTLTDSFNLVRKNKCICVDATDFNFREAFVKYGYPTRIDYLSMDTDPASVTYLTLTKLPLNDYRFSVITYEHDNYISGPEFMLKSRELLENYGYVRVVSNVLCCGRDFEDWYVDATYVPSEKYNTLIQTHIECQEVFTSTGINL
jgi:hypothetical protein